MRGDFDIHDFGDYLKRFSDILVAVFQYLSSNSLKIKETTCIAVSHIQI